MPNFRDALKQHDPDATFKFVCAQVDYAVKRGDIDREQAKKIIDGARENYRKHRYEKLMERKING